MSILGISKIPEKQIQKNAIEYTNAKKYENALTMIDDAIILIPSNPAGYNDKAQILSIGLFSQKFLNLHFTVRVELSVIGCRLKTQLKNS